MKNEQKENGKKTCPRCGNEMEAFAVAWGWGFCCKCSVELREEGQK